MPRAIWKGAISFGLVHIPVSLVSATSSQGVDFDWLDKRSMDPVGYKRINKTTGKEVTRKISSRAWRLKRTLRGAQRRRNSLGPPQVHPDHRNHRLRRQRPDPLQNIDTPYFLAPDKRGGKVYALLREALKNRQSRAGQRGAAYQATPGCVDAAGVGPGAGHAALARRSAQLG